MVVVDVLAVGRIVGKEQSEVVVETRVTVTIIEKKTHDQSVVINITGRVIAIVRETGHVIVQETDRVIDPETDALLHPVRKTMTR